MCVDFVFITYSDSEGYNRYGDGYRKYGRDDTFLPFSQGALDQIKTTLRLPQSFAKMLGEETTRCARGTLFDELGNVSGSSW